MNDDQLIQHLQTLVKPYIGTDVKQPTFSNNIIRYKSGLLKPNTLKAFFESMGYSKTAEGWVKA